MKLAMVKTLAITGVCLLQGVAFAAPQGAPTKMYNDKVYVELKDPNVSDEELLKFDTSTIQNEELRNAVEALIAARTQSVSDEVSATTNTDEQGLRAERYWRRGYWHRGYYRGYYRRGYWRRGYYGWRGYRYGYYGYPRWYSPGLCVGSWLLNFCVG